MSLKYDAAECSPGLLSMAWYPSLMVSGRRRMFTSVGEHGMVAIPPCSWSFSTSWFFHAGTRVLQRHVAPSLHLFLFLWKTFLLPNMKPPNAVRSAYAAFLLRVLLLASGALPSSIPWKKPIHSLQLFLAAAVC